MTCNVINLWQVLDDFTGGRTYRLSTGMLYGIVSSFDICQVLNKSVVWSSTQPSYGVIEKFATSAIKRVDIITISCHRAQLDLPAEAKDLLEYADE